MQAVASENAATYILHLPPPLLLCLGAAAKRRQQQRAPALKNVSNDSGCCGGLWCDPFCVVWAVVESVGGTSSARVTRGPHHRLPSGYQEPLLRDKGGHGRPENGPRSSRAAAYVPAVCQIPGLMNLYRSSCCLSECMWVCMALHKAPGCTGHHVCACCGGLRTRGVVGSRACKVPTYTGHLSGRSLMPWTPCLSWGSELLGSRVTTDRPSTRFQAALYADIPLRDACVRSMHQVCKVIAPMLVL